MIWVGKTKPQAFKMSRIKIEFDSEESLYSSVVIAIGLYT
jgi:hypothetical protein